MSELQALDKKELTAIVKLAAAESKRNHAMILTAFKHGMRASEVCDLRLGDIDLKNDTIVVRRLKGSLKSHQNVENVIGEPLFSEKRVLKAWLEERETYGDPSDFLFLSRKGGKMDRSAFFRLFQSLAERAGLPKHKTHPHCLKHALGFAAVERGVPLPDVQKLLGHKSLASTGVYVAVTDEHANRAASKMFANF
jgi:type 1 fimbriae regulatory protein FimB